MLALSVSSAAITLPMALCQYQLALYAKQALTSHCQGLRFAPRVPRGRTTPMRRQQLLSTTTLPTAPAAMQANTWPTRPFRLPPTRLPASVCFVEQALTLSLQGQRFAPCVPRGRLTTMRRRQHLFTTTLGTALSALRENTTPTWRPRLFSTTLLTTVSAVK
jgi:hypothetical protein